MPDPLAAYRHRRARLEQRQAEVRERIQREREAQRRKAEPAPAVAVKRRAVVSPDRMEQRILELFARYAPEGHEIDEAKPLRELLVATSLL